MPTPFGFHGILQLPGDVGLAPTAIPMVMASHFSAELIAVYRSRARARSRFRSAPSERRA